MLAAGEIPEWIASPNVMEVLHAWVQALARSQKGCLERATPLVATRQTLKNRVFFYCSCHIAFVPLLVLRKTKRKIHFLLMKMHLSLVKFHLCPYLCSGNSCAKYLIPLLVLWNLIVTSSKGGMGMYFMPLTAEKNML